jgi:RNA polymerase sigma-70 factor (ECF subfamily)
VQDFVTNKILERDLVSRADRARGRFRAFLLTALDRFFIDRCRQGKALKRARGEIYSLDDGPLEPRDKPQADVFDIAWGRMVLKETLRLMREGCQRGKPFDCACWSRW